MLVDHFLAYPGTRNLMALRNHPAIDKTLSKAHVESVEVVMEETILSNDRPYFRATGVTEDMVQNHGMQLLAAATMELHQGLDAPAFRQARVDALDSVKLKPGTVRRAQFEGFNDPAQGAPPDAEPSDQETYSAFEFEMGETRWRGVEFSMRAAKGVDRDRFGVDYNLKSLAPELAEQLGLDPNTRATLKVCVVPDASLRLVTEDGQTFNLTGDNRIDDQKPPYSVLLANAAKGEEGLFVDRRESLLAWDLVEQLKAERAQLSYYPRGSDSRMIAEEKSSPGVKPDQWLLGVS